MIMLVQAIGMVAAIIGISAPQWRSRQVILRVFTVSSLLWSLHFWLLGAHTGAAANFIGAIRLWVYGKLPDRSRSWLVPSAFIIIFAFMSVATWVGPASLLPLFAMTISSVGLWQKNPQRMRLINGFASPFWLVYNIISGSIPGILTETFLLISTVVALWRYRKSKIQ